MLRFIILSSVVLMAYGCGQGSGSKAPPSMPERITLVNDMLVDRPDFSIVGFTANLSEKLVVSIFFGDKKAGSMKVVSSNQPYRIVLVCHIDGAQTSVLFVIQGPDGEQGSWVQVFSGKFNLSSTIVKDSIKPELGESLVVGTIGGEKISIVISSQSD